MAIIIHGGKLQEEPRKECEDSIVIDYNQGKIAEQYQQAKTQPWRARIEAYSFLKAIGDVKGKKVLDVACGEGHYTRLLRHAGAEVVGIDISERMVTLAREQEAREPLGITYLVEDARTIASQQDFDIVVAAYLLVHAQDRAELTRMSQGLDSRVRPKGRFVTVTTNPGVYSFTPPDYRKYGIEMTLADHVFEGAPVEFSVLDDSAFRVVNYYLPLDAYESAFQAAGFHDFAVRMPALSAAPEAIEEGDYWDDILNYPFLITMECVRDSGSDPVS